MPKFLGVLFVMCLISLILGACDSGQKLADANAVGTQVAQ